MGPLVERQVLIEEGNVGRAMRRGERSELRVDEAEDKVCESQLFLFGDANGTAAGEWSDAWRRV